MRYGHAPNRAAPSRGLCLQVAVGEIVLNGQPLQAGDGAAVVSEEAVKITSQLLLFDLA